MREGRKAIFVLVDGLGGLPASGRKTELEIAKTPVLDRMMKGGACGLMHPIGMGVIPGSDTSQLNMLGYPPEKYYPGRGPLEALGIGMKLNRGDIALRANFATVDGKFNVIDRRAGRICTRDASKLAKEIAEMEIDGLKFMFKNSVEHRGAVVIRGRGISADFEGTDPHETGKRIIQPKLTRENAKTVRAINKYTARVHSILEGHAVNRRRKLKANMVLMRGAGMHKAVSPFRERFGMKACCIAGGALYKGIARYIGMDIIEVKGATGGYDADLNAKASAALKALAKYDFVYLHVKATDNAGHDGDTAKKVRMIEKVDCMVGKLAGADAVIFITGDHSTPVVKREHSFEPVPFLVHNAPARDYGCRKFSERECRKGELGIFTGDRIMRLVLAYTERIGKYGA